MFNVKEIRKEFPILSSRVYGHPLLYLDNAATTQVPEVVLESFLDHYHQRNANVHRGVHFLSEKNTQAFEDARTNVAQFINANSSDTIIFTKGTTESINKVALGLEHDIKPGDRIIVSVLEHHSNYVPWQQVCKRTGATFEVVGITAEGNLDMKSLEKLLALPAKIVAITACSNVLGTLTPLKKIVSLAHKAGALCLLDGAQVMRHALIDVQEINCDFFCFSGHKVLAPTGIGVLYAKNDMLEILHPTEFGGEMVDRVTQDETTFAQAPLRYEAGTPNYLGAIMLGKSLDFLEECNRVDIARYEQNLTLCAEEKLSKVPGLRLLGKPSHKSGCVSFTIDNVHPFDLCLMVDKLGVALRSGNNCAQPLLHEALDIKSATRLSVAFYNTEEEIEQAVQAIMRVLPFVRKNS